MKPQKTENQRFVSEIRDILLQIDKLMEEKSLEKNINFQSLGSIMERSNQQFYKSGIELGEFGFSTLATEKENKRELAMTFLSSIYSNWQDEQKEIYNILEIGAGSGDLMLEIFKIKDEVLSNPSSSEMHKKFFNSLKFNIFDFEEMNRLQREKLGEKSSEVNFISGDISKDLLPANKFDFVYGNEIPDTQRLEFLEVKTDEKTGEKKFFLRAIKTTNTGVKNEVLINLKSSPGLVKKIEENLLPISDLGDGIYKLQFGFHSLMHNIKQSLTEYGGLMLVDYFNFNQKHSIRDLTFVGADGSAPDEMKAIIQTGEPGKTNNSCSRIIWKYYRYHLRSKCWV
jgi:SAM-dependent MidA family methyltransferase